MADVQACPGLVPKVSWDDAEVDTAQICGYHGGGITGNIKNTGFWPDCSMDLTNKWVGLDHTDGADIFTDVGANMDSCALQLLLTTNAKIIAFEPVRRNSFCLTNTLLRLSRGMRSRVVVRPIGLGSSDGALDIYTAINEPGVSSSSHF